MNKRPETDVQIHSLMPFMHDQFMQEFD